MEKIVRNTNFKVSHACDQFIGFQFFYRSYTACLYITSIAFTASCLVKVRDKKILFLTDVAFRVLLVLL